MFKSKVSWLNWMKPGVAIGSVERMNIATCIPIGETMRAESGLQKTILISLYRTLTQTSRNRTRPTAKSAKSTKFKKGFLGDLSELCGSKILVQKGGLGSAPIISLILVLSSKRPVRHRPFHNICGLSANRYGLHQICLDHNKATLSCY